MNYQKLISNWNMFVEGEKVYEYDIFHIRNKGYCWANAQQEFKSLQEIGEELLDLLKENPELDTEFNWYR